MSLPSIRERDSDNDSQFRNPFADTNSVADTQADDARNPFDDSSAEDTLQEQPPEPPYHIFTKRQKWFVIVIIGTAGLFSGLSSNIYFPSLDAISRDLHVSAEMVSLTITSYLIIQGISPLFWGSISDALGRRPIYIASFAVYIISNIGLSFSPNFTILMVFRALQAAGSASTVSIGNGVIQDISPPAEREDPEEPLPRKKVTAATFLEPLRLLVQRDILINLIFGGVVYTIWSMVTSSTTGLFKQLFNLNELQIGLAFLPNGFGTIVGSAIAGKLMTRDYKAIEEAYKASHNMEKSEKLTAKNMPADFPIERARLRRLPWVVVIFIASTGAYGVSLNFPSATSLTGWIAVPLTLQFFIAATSNAVFALNQTLVTDLCPGKGARYPQFIMTAPEVHAADVSSKAIKIQQQLTQYLDKYVSNNQKSLQCNKEASGSLPGGTTRSVLYYEPFPLAFSGGHGCHLTSMDGEEYLDFLSEYCAGMFGHSHPDIIAAIESVTKSGFTLGGPGPKEGELGKLLVDRFPSIDAIRFCNSGTEANTMAIATALHFIGRKKILVFENGYHGGTLAFTPGNPLILPHDFVQGRYNDIEYTRPLITEELGIIIVEPLQGAAGMFAGTKEFLQFLRDEATRVGAILIFDEVITSRLNYGGLQEIHGIVPDMTTIGKHFGGGFSFGAFGGKKEIMDLYDPSSPTSLHHSGTWNNNKFSMTAGVAATKLLSREALDKNNGLGNKLKDGLGALFKAKDESILTLSGFGSVIGVHFNGPSADNLRDLFFFYMLSKRIYVGRRGFLALNITHEEEHVNRVLAAAKDFCDEVL
ncbi:hypothetical protein K4K55_004098 [Colletotrichum sp. SAR 10_96]|nr:hypothetical protein K4K55_004098 [Colletotrichum sp. SAR 10_96]